MGCEFIRIAKPPTARGVHGSTKRALRGGEPFPCTIESSVHASHEETLRGAYKR